MSSIAPVSISRLKLDRFRNYSTIDLETDTRSVVLTGDNGSGKTNLLEAVSLLSPGRGLRRAPYERIAQAGAEGPQAGTWSVHARLQREGEETAIGTGLQAGADGPSGSRRISINGSVAKSSEALSERARVLWLTPAMDGLFTGPPGDRRRFLDRLVLAVEPAHGRQVSAFERAMRGRNKLLEENGDPAWLDGIEQQMAQAAATVASARLRLVNALRETMEARTQTVFPDALLRLAGTVEESAVPGGEAELADIYRTQLVRNRPRDAAAGRTLEGPHRSDLLVHHAGKQMEAALCSTGEQKALLIGLVLAHTSLVSRMARMTPLLLLDEVAAHLDPDRRAALFDLVEALGCQAWMTGTDPHLFESLGPRAQHFTVAAGTLHPAE